MRLFSPRLLAATLLAGSTLFGADPKNSEAKKEEAKSEEFDLPVPVGIPMKGIKIPHRNQAGKLVMTLEAEVAKKLDDQHIEMENMKIESLDDEGKTINVQVPHSVFNLETRILSGDSQTLIRREDFEITGDAVEFNTKTRYAILRGNIRMIIQSANIEK
ncbi:MAG: LPS export ABC transporter periplasmic protein LptC [Verrucomicrobiae bacterium]